LRKKRVCAFEVTINALTGSLTIRGSAASVDCVEVVRFAEHPSVVQGKFLAGGQLSFAGIARKAGQVVHVLSRLPHPVSGGDRPATLGALGAETPGANNKTPQTFDLGE